MENFLNNFHKRKNKTLTGKLLVVESVFLMLKIVAMKNYF